MTSATFLSSTKRTVYLLQNRTVLFVDNRHMEMILVYNRIPDLYGTTSGEGYTYMLGGSTCLAGDFLGSYCFEKPLQIGDKIIFLEMGGYTLVTIHHFNGVNLPSLYKYSDNKIALLKHFEYPYFRDKWV